jgi:cell division inhibitor SepF
MSKFTDKVKNIFTVDYDDYDDDYYDEYEDEEEVVVEQPKPARPKPERKPTSTQASTPRQTRTATPSPGRSFRSSRNSKVVPMRGSEMEVCVIKPTYYESTREIIDTLLEGKAVVLNLEGMKLDLAQRIVDSVSGGCYAISGNLQKISGYIYLVTPKSVDITGDFQELISDSTDFSSSYRRDF